MKQYRVTMNKVTSRRSFLVCCCAALSLWGAWGVRAEGAKPPWFKIALAQGEANGYRWAVSAKGEKTVPLKRMCVIVAMVEPPQGNLPVEGEEATGCGRLSRSADHVIASVPFGADKSKGAVLAIAVRPSVRRVVLAFFGAESRKVVGAALPSTQNSQKGEIPRFRYIAVPFERQSCIRRITGQDRENSVVFSQALSHCQLP